MPERSRATGRPSPGAARTAPARPGTSPAPPGAGRVIAGIARGMKLAAPGTVARPLGDRVKEALFAILESELRGATFLDLFAGSGAAGIEALSRGAAAATFVERNRAAEAVIRSNLDRAHLAGPAARVVQAEAIHWLSTAPAFGNGPFRVVLVDPPYDKPELLIAALGHLGRPGGILSPGAVVVAKHFSRTELPAVIGLLASERARRFGDTALTFYRVAGSTEAGA